MFRKFLRISQLLWKVRKISKNVFLKVPIKFKSYQKPLLMIIIRVNLTIISKKTQG